MDKPKINSSYHTISLSEDWTSYSITSKINIMDQDDRYNIATQNWSYTLEDLENRLYDILHTLTCKNNEEITAMMIAHEQEKNK